MQKQRSKFCFWLWVSPCSSSRVDCLSLKTKNYKSSRYCFFLLMNWLNFGFWKKSSENLGQNTIFAVFLEKKIRPNRTSRRHQTNQQPKKVAPPGPKICKLWQKNSIFPISSREKNFLPINLRDLYSRVPDAKFWGKKVRKI